METITNSNQQVMIPDEALQHFEPSALVAMAIQKDLDITKLEKLLDLQERWEKREAEKAFIRAMNAFKQNPPKIYKDMLVQYQSSKGIVKYNHASLGNVVAVLTEALAKHNISARWTFDQKDGQIYVTNILRHEAGHSESVTMFGPPDTSGCKNPIQAISSTQTLIERYTFLANVGLATNENETDGISEKLTFDDKKKLIGDMILELTDQKNASILLQNIITTHNAQSKNGRLEVVSSRSKIKEKQIDIYLKIVTDYYNSHKPKPKQPELQSEPKIETIL